MLSILFVLSTELSRAGTSGKYVLGVFPNLPPRELEKIFAPMAAEISKVVGKPVILRTSPTFQKFMQQLDSQEFDIAFVQPFDYVDIADKYGYLPLATRQEELSAILVTKPDSAIREVNDLKGKIIALPPEVAAVSYLIKDYLATNGLEVGKDVTLLYQRSHVICMRMVMSGKADACGTAIPAQRFFQNKMKVTLRIIGKSKSIPHTLFCVHPRVPESSRDKIKQLILSWGDTDKGQQMLKRGRFNPLIPITNKDYDIVRRMKKGN